MPWGKGQFTVVLLSKERIGLDSVKQNLLHQNTHVPEIQCPEHTGMTSSPINFICLFYIFRTIQLIPDNIPSNCLATRKQTQQPNSFIKRKL